ncbi:MAG: 30S ribosomal protein S3, partial [Firmicutes bacterium]|nr:30S ribosomal protein S3 [Bacillota bacterium]
MGQKVNPRGFRVGVTEGWDSQWFAGNKKDVARYIKEDNSIREVINTKHKDGGISVVRIARTTAETTVTIHASRPGVLIGQKGAGIEAIKKNLKPVVSDTTKLNITIKEIKAPDIDPTVVAQTIATQLEKRGSYKHAMKQAMQRALKGGAKGIKVMVGGRLGGAEIARSEFYKQGRLPLHTIRSDIKYGTATARSQAGAIGIKVWIYYGEILGKRPLVEIERKGG